MQNRRYLQHKRPIRHTLCDDFCDTYVVDGRMHSFILLPKMLVDSRLGEGKASLLSPMGKVENFCECDGTPAYRIRHKFHRSIRQRGDSPTGLYGCLETFFTEAAIKALFPEVWILNNNERARKRNAGEVAMLNRARKLDPNGFALHGQCEKRTRNLSVVRSAREERGLAV